MSPQTVCPRCGARNSFRKGYLPETCVCGVCQSQLDWREIPGCGPDCQPVAEPETVAQPEGPPAEPETPEAPGGGGQKGEGDQPDEEK